MSRAYSVANIGIEPVDGEQQARAYSVTNIVAAVPLTINVWNGSSWVAKPLRYWNGQGWIDAPALKYWDGSAWQTV